MLAPSRRIYPALGVSHLDPTQKKITITSGPASATAFLTAQEARELAFRLNVLADEITPYNGTDPERRKADADASHWSVDL